MIAIVDYGMGNLRSVEKAFIDRGCRPKVTSLVKDIEKADKIVLPGVGAFTHAMRELKKLKLVGPIRAKIESGTPYLGLCLGLQLLFSRSEEGEKVKGLGIIAGPVKRFRGLDKVPHMGWNTLKVIQKNNALMKGVGVKDYFYFVHSYYGVPEDKSWILSRTRYGTDFCSAISKGSVFATQFHPEKSQAAGLRLIQNFIAFTPPALQT